MAEQHTNTSPVASRSGRSAHGLRRGCSQLLLVVPTLLSCMHIQDVLPRTRCQVSTIRLSVRNTSETSDDEVIVVETTPARAYPVRILSYHEIVNDVLGDRRRFGNREGNRPGGLYCRT
ncbi:MAG: DUF3179 domain-containing (seleno)protein [Halobacteriales archaeon]|nr:DUF3179 domain-containing (seleno)protein [Halobacteriales archaeon]